MAALLTAIATAVSLILPPSAVTGNTGNGLAVLPPATGGKASEPSVPVGGGGGGGDTDLFSHEITMQNYCALLRGIPVPCVLPLWWLTVGSDKLALVSRARVIPPTKELTGL